MYILATFFFFLPLKLTSDVPTLLQSFICSVMMQFDTPTAADMQLFVGLHSKMGHEIIRFKNKFLLLFLFRINERATRVK